MKNLRISLPLFVLFAYSNILIAQVGIGTTDPQATLHVDGDVKVEGDLEVITTNTAPAVKIKGLDAANKLTGVTLGANLTLSGGTLSASGGGGDHKTETMKLINMNFAEFDNLNLGISGTSDYGNNSDVTVFILRDNNDAGALDINGITGGTDGRRIRIINDSGLEVEFFEDEADADAGNRIYIYTEKSKMKQYGSCTLIYSTDISGDGHWCVVQLDRYRN